MVLNLIGRRPVLRLPCITSDIYPWGLADKQAGKKPGAFQRVRLYQEKKGVRIWEDLVTEDTQSKGSLAAFL
jgi:hypothetical protein